MRVSAGVFLLSRILLLAGFSIIQSRMKPGEKEVNTLLKKGGEEAKLARPTGEEAFMASSTNGRGSLMAGSTQQENGCATAQRLSREGLPSVVGTKLRVSFLLIPQSALARRY